MCATCSPNCSRDVVCRHRSVFDGVVQEPGGNRGGVQLHLREHLRNLKRMNHIRFAGGPDLPLMMFKAKLPGLADDLHVVAGAVSAYGIEQGAEARVDQRTVIWGAIVRSASVQSPGIQHTRIGFAPAGCVRVRRRCTRGRHA